MSPHSKPHIVIAGAGPVGLTLALLLGSKDIAVTVLEAEAAISEELRASTFHPPTLPIAHNGLMNSPGHRANILRPEFGRVGIGIMDGGLRGLMVTQKFRN